MLNLPVLQLQQLYVRRALSNPLGKLYVSRGKISGFKVDYSVGDIVSLNQNSEYRVTDSKVMRTRIESTRKIVCDTYVYNPPGNLSLNTLTILKTKLYRNICVIGEDDLVVLGIGREKYATIAYGQPRVGVVIYNADPIFIVNIIKTFKPVLISYSSHE